MAFECKHSQRWKKRVKHPQSYSFIFVLLNLPHAQKRKSELFRGEDSEFPEIKSSCHGYDYVRDQRMRTVIEGEKAPSFYHWLPLQNVCWCVNIVCETFKGVFSRVKHSRHLCCFHRQQGLTEWAAGGGSIRKRGTPWKRGWYIMLWWWCGGGPFLAGWDHSWASRDPKEQMLQNEAEGCSRWEKCLGQGLANSGLPPAFVN